MKDNYVYWKCTKCNDHRMSDKRIRWKMDWCKCGESAVDAEEHYSRYLGSAEIITEEKYEEGIRNTSGKS